MLFKSSFLLLLRLSHIMCAEEDANGGGSKRALATCPTGGIIDQSGTFCCLASCGSCGGSGCDKRVGGASGCCTSQITQSCSNSGLPCLAVKSDSFICPDEGVVDVSNQFCCPSYCGKCGGYGCHLLPGGASNCCTSQITDSCSTNSPPCKFEEPNSDNDCPSGGILDGSGSVCCPANCGECGGYGCDLRPGGASQCCTSQISNSCSTNTMPCKLDNDAPSSGENNYDICWDGILSDVFKISNACEAQFCCPKSCPSCSTEYECDLEPECCAYTYLIGMSVTYSDVEVSCRSMSPPCLVIPENDPCYGNSPCENGAQCGVAWGETWPMTDEGSCFSQVHCECEDVGNYYGEFCELSCGEGETPCGEVYGGYGSTEFSANDKCCSVDEVCVNWGLKYSKEKMCKSNARPLSCDPDPCLNGGSCYNTNIYNSNDPYYGCSCPYGFSGQFCEVEDS